MSMLQTLWKSLSEPESWLRLRAKGKSRALRSSYFWLAFVPIVARLLENLEPDQTLDLFGATINITLKLPFSWSALFFAALSFGVATAIYDSKSPRLVSDFEDFAEFKRRGRASSYISQTFMASIHRLTHPQASSDQIVLFLLVVRRFVRRVGQESDLAALERAIAKAANSDGIGGAMKFLIDFDIPEDREVVAFEECRNRVSSERPGWRMACTAFYRVGYLLGAIILIENVRFVWEQSF